MDSLFEDRGNYCWHAGFWVDYNHNEDKMEEFIEDSPKYNLPEKIRKLKALVDK